MGRVPAGPRRRIGAAAVAGFLWNQEREARPINEGDMGRETLPAVPTRAE